MTEEVIEKQAEEYADEILKLKPKNILSRRDMLVMDFQDGAKWGIANAIEWHDLRKNPNDLPKETGKYLTDDGSVYIYDTDSKKWREPMCMACWNFDWIDDGDVIAWCELPQFKEKE